jgi:hypothetical protein
MSILDNFEEYLDIDQLDYARTCSYGVSGVSCQDCSNLQTCISDIEDISDNKYHSLSEV